MDKQKCVIRKCFTFLLATKIRLLIFYTYPLLLYEAETWSLTEKLSKRIKTFQIWLFCKILNMLLIYGVCNARVLQYMQKEKNN